MRPRVIHRHQVRHQSPIEPVEIASISTLGFSPSFMIESSRKLAFDLSNCVFDYRGRFSLGLSVLSFSCVTLIRHIFYEGRLVLIVMTNGNRNESNSSLRVYGFYMNYAIEQLRNSLSYHYTKLLMNTSFWRPKRSYPASLITLLP